MNVSLYQAAAGMKATARWQEVVAENLASSSIPGYKRQNMSFGSVEAGLLGPSSVTLPNGSRHFSLSAATVGTDFQPGELKPSTGPADLAIEGRGFFEVELPNGKRAYTRDGEFHPTAQGILVTKQGFVLQGTDGPIQLDGANGSPLHISSTGQVSQGSEPRGSVKVVDFADYGTLDTLGGGLYAPRNPAAAAPVDQVSVRHGYVEGSNTTVVREMADLLSSVRLFEANQKVIQVQDERMARLIADLGSPV